MENNIPNVWSTHPAGHVTIETSRILELFGTQEPNEKRNDFLYAVDRVLLDLNHKDKREKYEFDLYQLLDALKYSLSETSIRTFD
jgi:hypothetical protein